MAVTPNNESITFLAGSGKLTRPGPYPEMQDVSLAAASSGKLLRGSISFGGSDYAIAAGVPLMMPTGEYEPEPPELPEYPFVAIRFKVRVRVTVSTADFFTGGVGPVYSSYGSPYNYLDLGSGKEDSWLALSDTGSTETADILTWAYDLSRDGVEEDDKSFEDRYGDDDEGLPPGTIDITAPYTMKFWTRVTLGIHRPIHPMLNNLDWRYFTANPWAATGTIGGEFTTQYRNILVELYGVDEGGAMIFLTKTTITESDTASIPLTYGGVFLGTASIAPSAWSTTHHVERDFSLQTPATWDEVFTTETSQHAGIRSTKQLSSEEIPENSLRLSFAKNPDYNADT